MFLAKKKESAQRKWQLKQLEKGLCMSCGQDKIFKRGLCYKHYLKYFAEKTIPSDKPKAA